jgi:hypothetical protein
VVSQAQAEATGGRLAVIVYLASPRGEQEMAEATVAEQDEATAGAARTDEDFEYERSEGRADGGDGDAPEANGKRTLADLAAEAPDADASTEGDADGQSQLFGTERKVTASVKGPRPTTSHVSFKAGEVEVQGQFHPEDVVELRMVVELDEVSMKYRRKGGKIVDTRRVHKAKAIPGGVQQLNLPPELIMARHEYVAAALGVDVGELIAATERAMTEVQLPE